MMANTDDDLWEAAYLISEMLPQLLEDLNNSPGLPAVHGLTQSNITVSCVPPDFTDETAFAMAARTFSKIVSTENDPEKVIHADLIGTQLVVVSAKPTSETILCNFSYHDKEVNRITIATLQLSKAGKLQQIHTPKVYIDGSFLNRKSGEYLTSLLTCMLLKSADDSLPGSGISCTVINGIRLYTYKQLISGAGDYIGAPVNLPAKQLPRIRRELAKEMRGYTLGRPEFGDTVPRYFKDIGDQIERSQEMWWVSEDMSKLAWDTAMSNSGPEDLSDRDLPAPAGIMWLNGGGGPVLTTRKFPDENFLKTGETPVERMTMNAIIWYTPTVHIPGVELGKPRFMSLTASPELARETTHWGSLLSPLDLESNEIEYKRLPTYVTHLSLKELPRNMALIVMRLAREESVGEKRLETVGNVFKKKSRNREISLVTCASLRRHRYITDDEKQAREAESREYSHRWIVRGHMRNQAVGPRLSDGERKHIRIWIAPFVKGPDDKPLVLKDRVQLFLTTPDE